VRIWLQLRMGHLLGAKEMNAAKNAAYIGISISAMFMRVMAVCYWLLPGFLISADFDIHNPNNLEIISDIKGLLIVAGFFQIFEGIRISLFGALRALKDTNFTLLISILSFWCIALPVGYLLATYGQLGGKGLWIGMVISAVISMSLLYWRFKAKI